jgi:hypothetical protein
MLPVSGCKNKTKNLVPAEALAWGRASLAWMSEFIFYRYELVISISVLHLILVEGLIFPFGKQVGRIAIKLTRVYKF